MLIKGADVNKELDGETSLLIMAAKQNNKVTYFLES